MEVSSAVCARLCARARFFLHVHGFVCAVQRIVIVHCSVAFLLAFAIFSIFYAEIYVSQLILSSFTTKY